jgi:hypothetical protein
VLQAAAADASEIVRQAAARAARVSGDPLLRGLLAAMTDPGREPTPRVRAVAACVLADRVLGSAGEPERGPAAETLARVVASDPDDLPRRVACDLAARLAAGDVAGPIATATLRQALDAARTGTFSPELSNAIARAAERAGLDRMIGGLVETRLAMGTSACIAAGLGGFLVVDLDTPLFLAHDPFRGGIRYDGDMVDLRAIDVGHGCAP